ncbi:MAG: hypothetical protein QGH42_12725 [Kiritimatiellia bacterium]|jgi:hypothetical protein|nr:hypothetical protein [Kiritimatiellia bacterium]MDP6631178.1 hypothetical protein [Kiritimatiellia bacterium]MDP6809800.1 hypothetical protein [Kiritimatiellia bacterium]MDP7025090.1 hypothetical protein [Kiritimatiellia bacterium]
MKQVLQHDVACRRSGAVMIEYIVVAVMLMAATAILAVFLYSFREFGGRALDLIASEYP